MNRIKLDDKGFVWIDHVTIEDVSLIVFDGGKDDRHIEVYDDCGGIVAYANISFCDEIGYCEYDSDDSVILYSCD